MKEKEFKFRYVNYRCRKCGKIISYETNDERDVNNRIRQGGTRASSYPNNHHFFDHSCDYKNNKQEEQVIYDCISITETPYYDAAKIVTQEEVKKYKQEAI